MNDTIMRAAKFVLIKMRNSNFLEDNFMEYRHANNDDLAIFVKNHTFLATYASPRQPSKVV